MRPLSRLLCLTLMVGCQGRSVSPESTVGAVGAAVPTGGVVVLGAAPERAGRVRCEQAVLAPVVSIVRAPVEVVASPDGMAQVSSTVLARVVRWHRAPGDVVRSGEALVTLDSPVVAEGRTQRARARIDVADLTQRVSEEDTMHASGATSARELRSTRTALARAHEEVSSAERALSVAQADPSGAGGQFSLRAPISGVLAVRAVHVGAVVQPATLLGTVIDRASLRVQADVGESVGSITLGERAVVTLRGRTTPITARVVWQDVTLRRTTRTRAIQLSPDGAEPLSVGETGSVRIERQGPPGVLIPMAAVYREGEATTVYVRVGEGRYAPRRVVTGGDDGERVAVLSGVSAGEWVVTEGSFLVAGEHARQRE